MMLLMTLVTTALLFGALASDDRTKAAIRVSGPLHPESALLDPSVFRVSLARNRTHSFALGEGGRSDG